MGAAKHTTTAKAQRALRKDIHSSFDQVVLGKDLVGGLYTCEGERSRRAALRLKLGCSAGLCPGLWGLTAFLAGEPGISSFQGGRQSFKCAQSFFQSSVCEPDRRYDAASTQRPFRTGFAQM